MLIRRTLFVAAAIVATAAPSAAQHEQHLGASVSADTGISLFNNLGPHTRTVTTTSALAQQYFNQGMRLAWGFGMPEARRSFEAAIRQDPACAMCHWGLAWSLGPYVNGGMDSINGLKAYEHIQHAKQRARNATDAEKAMIDAMVVRYVANPKRGSRSTADTAYMNAMREVSKRFPNDLDIATLFGESMMVLRPWNYWTKGGEPQPGIDELVRTLESILARNLSHPGACHLFIHTTEASTQPRRAEKCADLLIDGMPGASHMRHMPSHTYMRIGRYGDGVRSNQLAWIADQQATHGGATAIYPSHNLHMLLFAASYDGQSAVAIQAARDLAKLAPSSAHQLPLVLARFGRWDEILEMPAPAQPFRFAMWNYARGLAQLHTSEVPNARMSLAAVEAALNNSTNKNERNQLRIAHAILGAEIDALAKKYDDAVRKLESVRTVETDSLAYDEPEEWLIPLRQVMGAILLDAGRAADAEAAYRGELQTHEENGWSLYGLYLSLAAQNRTADADAMLTRFRNTWQRADVHIRASRF